MISFGVKYWFILLLTAFVAAAGLVYLLYSTNKNNEELTKGQRYLLMTFRFFSFTLTAFLLLSPFVKSLKKTVRNPLIIAAWDNSGSVGAAADSAMQVTEMNRLKNMISKELGNDYSVINYTFGQKTTYNGEINFSEKRSDYSDLVNTLNNNHFNENIGALLLAGDGIYNHGKNPLNMLDDITFPVYSIGFGDTTEITDARIQTVKTNRTAFSGNRFPVVVDSRFIKLHGQALKLTIFEGDKEVAQDVIVPNSTDYFNSTEFILEAGDPGLKRFTAVLETAENEENIRNNTEQFVVNVLESKQKILILSDGYHPDIGAVKNTLEKQKSYDVSVFTEEPYPSNFSDFNLVILNQLPTSGKSMSDIINKEENKKTPLLFIIGGKTFLPQLNALAHGVNIRPRAGSKEDAQAALNSSYSAFSTSENLREVVEKFPPLTVHFANYELDPAFNILLYQKIKNIETGSPLIATGIHQNKKVGFLFGEGIWRWRLNNYFQNQTHSQFGELIGKLIQYLALRENEDNFIVNYDLIYAETDPVLFSAEVYNEIFERIPNEEVSISISSESGEELNFIFDVRDNGYYLNAGNLPVDNYHFSAEVTTGDQTRKKSGNFVVTPVNIENLVTRANHSMLYQLSSETGGSFYTLEETGTLSEEIKKSRTLKPVSYFQEMITELINLRWLFPVILVLLSVEWFLRKYWGIY